ncbi:uncharacterized protein LOC130569016 isoform X2 [Triplophysa rosa]|uniref:uncharacterized protein LOC130569016 isoform X2 n=1 Tax=Triplophysa rosa TaxID=992332 RepID=UPI002546267C|nr:uncharacterized protein LOC130569016 isoform X2 [Triplophysa rosa]
MAKARRPRLGKVLKDFFCMPVVIDCSCKECKPEASPEIDSSSVSSESEVFVTAQTSLVSLVEDATQDNVENRTEDNKTQGIMEKSQWDLKHIRFSSGRLTRLDDFVARYPLSHTALLKEYEDSKRVFKRKTYRVDQEKWKECQQKKRGDMSHHSGSHFLSRPPKIRLTPQCLRVPLGNTSLHYSLVHPCRGTKKKRKGSSSGTIQDISNHTASTHLLVEKKNHRGCGFCGFYPTCRTNDYYSSQRAPFTSTTPLALWRAQTSLVTPVEDATQDNDELLD